MQPVAVPRPAQQPTTPQPMPVDPVVIEPDCWLGFGSSILPGTRLGRGSIVAARSVVRGDVAPYTTVAGNPAVPVGQREPG